MYNGDKRSATENGRHPENGSSIINSSSSAVAAALSEVEKRDMDRKAALAEAESVLRALSFAPTTSSVKKDDGRNGQSNGSEKVGEGDNNAAISADKNSSDAVENPNNIKDNAPAKPKSRSDAVAAAKRRAEERKRAAASGGSKSNNDQASNAKASSQKDSNTNTTSQTTTAQAVAAAAAVNPNSQMDWFNLLGVVTNPGYDSWHGGPPTTATSHHATNTSSYHSRSRHRSGGLSSHGTPISLDHVGSDGTRGSTTNGIGGESYAASLFSAAGMTEWAGFANSSSAQASAALNTMAGSLDDFTGWFDHYSRKYLGTVPGIDGGPLMGGEGGDDGDDMLGAGGIVGGLGVGSTPIWEEFEPEFGPDDVPELQLEELPSDIAELDLVSVERFLKSSGMLGMRFEDRGGGFKAMRERSKNRGKIPEKSEDENDNDIDNEAVHVSAEDNLSTTAEVAKAIEAVPEIFFSSHFDLTDPVCFEKLLVVSDEEVAQIRAKEAELHALAEQKLKEADEKARQDEENDTTIPTRPPRRTEDKMNLNSLPEQSGSSLTKEGHETSRPTAGNVITLRKPETFTLHLDAVELALLDQVRSKSEKFFRETNRFSELQKLVTESVDEVKELRTEIHSLQERCVTNVELVPIMDNTRADLRAISRVLEGIEDVVNCKASIASLMSAGDHLGAIEALRVARSLLAQTPEQESGDGSSQHLSLGKLRALSKVGDQLDEYEKLVVRNITDELVDTFLSWGTEGDIDFRAPPRISLTTDRRANIRGVVQSLRLCGQLSVAGATYQKRLCDLISVTVKAIVTECVADAAKTSGNGTDASAKGISGVASMSLDQFLDCLKMLFEQVLGLLWGAVAVNKYCISEGILLDDKAASNEATNSADGQGNEASQLTKSATAAALSAAADLAEKSVSELLRLRREAHSLVSFDGMRQLWDTSLTFTLQLERFSGKKAYGLRSTLLAQAKSFVERKHESNMSSLVAALDSERWVQCNVSAERQAALTRLCSGRAAFSSRATGRGGDTVAASNVPLSPAAKMADADVEGVRYKVVWSCLLLLEMVMDDVACAAHFQTLAANIVGKVCELLRLFNTRSTHLVLGAGAIHSAARLKSINAKHLAIVTQCIALMLAILPHIRAALMAQLPAKQHALLTDLDKIKTDYAEHSEKVLNKLVSIIGGIVEHSLAPKISKTSFDQRARSIPMPENPDTALECCAFLDSVLTNTTKMHQVLKVMLPDELLRDVFSRIFAYLDHKIPSLYKAAATSAEKNFTMPATDDGKIRMIKEVQYVTGALNCLPGVLPWKFTALKVLEQELDIIVIQSEPEDVQQEEVVVVEKNESADGVSPSVDSDPIDNKKGREENVEGDGNLPADDETSAGNEEVPEEQTSTVPEEQAESSDANDGISHEEEVSVASPTAEETQTAEVSEEQQVSTVETITSDSETPEESINTDAASDTGEVSPVQNSLGEEEALL
ncbi:hypothetical protein ACHAWT_005179 [Skeletonema menzelii]